MKKNRLIILCLILILGLCGCGLFSASENAVTGKYYLAVRPDKRGKNTVLKVEDETLRLKVNGTAVLLADGREREGRWEVERKRVRLIFDEETVTGWLDGERITIGNGVYLRGKAAAQTLWDEDAAAYIADPLAEYEGKYYLAGLLAGGENRVEAVDNVTLWLMAKGEAMLFESGKLTLLGWDASGSEVRINGEESSFLGAYENGQITGEYGGCQVVLLREEDEAQAYLAAHPYVPEPARPPVLSGFEGCWYLGGASFFGRSVELEQSGLLRINIMPDGIMVYEGPGFTEEGTYLVGEDRTFEIRIASETMTGSIMKGRMDLNGMAGDHYIFFSDPKRANSFRLTENARIRAEMTPTQPTVPSETVPPETAPAQTSVPEATKSSTPAPAETTAAKQEGDQDFWDGVWFGFVRLNDSCTGLYRLMRGKCYAVYAVLKMNDDGTGTLIGYDPAATFTERLLSGKVRCGEDRTLILTEGVIEAFDAKLEIFTAAYDEEKDLVCFSLTKPISGGTVGGDLYLRRWGESWEDLPEFVTQIPGYESYLEEIRTGIPRYGAD